MSSYERRNRKFATAYVAARNLIDDSVGKGPGKRIELKNLTKEELEEYKESLKIQKRAVKREYKVRLREERRLENKDIIEENKANAKKAVLIMAVAVAAIGSLVLVKKAVEIQQAKVEYAITHADEITAKYYAEQAQHEDKPGRDLLDVGEEAVEKVADFFKGIGGK